MQGGLLRFVTKLTFCVVFRRPIDQIIWGVKVVIKEFAKLFPKANVGTLKFA